MGSLDYKTMVPQLEADLENFNLMANLSTFKLNQSVNIKRIFYRSITLFVSALGRIHGLRQNSSFDIIKELYRKGKMSDLAAHRLSHAVAVACHIRMFHYTSKERQADNIHNEDEELGGKKKLKALAEIVSKTWLIKFLVTVHTLQEILKYDHDISEYHEILGRSNTCFTMRFWGLMGMDDDVLRSGEYIFKDLSTPNVFNYHGLTDLCMAYISTDQYEKCLELIERFKDKIPKRPLLDAFKKGLGNFNDEEIKHLETTYEEKKFQKSNNFDNLENFLIFAKAQCLYYLGNKEKKKNNNKLTAQSLFYQPVVQETDALLKFSSLDPALRIKSLKYNSLGKLNLGKYHEALSAFRDLFKLYKREKKWVQGTMSPDTMGHISLCLVKIGRRQQAIHWAREGLNYIIHIEAVEGFLDEAMKLLHGVTDPDAHFDLI